MNTFSNLQLLDYTHTIKHRLDYNPFLLTEFIACIKALDSREINTQELKSGVFGVNWNTYETESLTAAK